MCQLLEETQAENAQIPKLVKDAGNKGFRLEGELAKLNEDLASGKK